jgi:hypothetical protein
VAAAREVGHAGADDSAGNRPRDCRQSGEIGPVAGRITAPAWGEATRPGDIRKSAPERTSSSSAPPGSPLLALANSPPRPGPPRWFANSTQ